MGRRLNFSAGREYAVVSSKEQLEKLRYVYRPECV